MEKIVTIIPEIGPLRGGYPEKQEIF